MVEGAERRGVDLFKGLGCKIFVYTHGRGVAETVADHTHAASEALREPHAEGIVEIEHRRAEAGRVEQARLALGISIHRAVVAEMVGRKIREEGTVETNAVYPALERPAGRHFH